MFDKVQDLFTNMVVILKYIVLNSCYGDTKGANT